MTPSRRNALILIVLCGAGGYAFHRGADNFWGVISCGLIALWALVYMLPVMDAGWRIKTGFVAVSFAAAFIALWPTLESASGGRVKCPWYFKSHITFGIAPGLDLRGGLRLVYTVEVEEAIRDKRDHYADDMRQDLATIFGFHSGEGFVTRDELNKLEDKVHVSNPKDEPQVIRVSFKDQGDIGKLDARYQKRFATELLMQRGPGNNTVTFKIRTEVETGIRDKAVSQAKDTINKRVDELGLREASVTTRDEDIIVEVPGENQKAFEEIKDIIRRTARLEFKMVDVVGMRDFFSRYKEADQCKAGDANCLPANQGFAIFEADEPDGPGRSVKTPFIHVQRQPNETQQQCYDRLEEVGPPMQDVPDDREIGFQEDVDYDPDTLKTDEKGWRTWYLYRRADITGDLITDASVQQDQEHTGGYLVAVAFNNVGAERFEEVTARERPAPLRDHPRCRRHRLAPRLHPHEDWRRTRHHHAGRGRPRGAARQGAQARARPPERRAPRAHLAVERVAHRPLPRRRRHRSSHQGHARRREPSCSASSRSSTTARAASSRTSRCSST